MSNVIVLPKNMDVLPRYILESNNVDKALVFSKASLLQQYSTLRKQLPNVMPYYAIKSCPHPTLISILKDQGCGFDVATTGEIELIKTLGVNGSSTIHTHPIKSDIEIRNGIEFGCRVFVIDNISELHKFVPYKDKVQLLLRLSFPNPDAIVDLSRKFGCVEKDIDMLIDKSKELGISIVGLSFHVGSQSKNSKKHVHAIDVCAAFIKKHNLQILDIGGGFPIDYHASNQVSVDEFFSPIREELKKIPVDIELICEPGRFLSGPSFTCISKIEGVSERTDATWYYMNDGVYGSYSGTLFDHVTYKMYIYSDSSEQKVSVISGPTCDSIDVIVKEELLPPLEIGDIIVGENMGAYTMATSTIFNCISPPIIIDM